MSHHFLKKNWKELKCRVGDVLCKVRFVLLWLGAAGWLGRHQEVDLPLTADSPVIPCTCNHSDPRPPLVCGCEHMHTHTHVCPCARTLLSGSAWTLSSETESPERQEGSCYDAFVPLVSSQDGTGWLRVFPRLIGAKCYVCS